MNYEIYDSEVETFNGQRNDRRIELCAKICCRPHRTHARCVITIGYEDDRGIDARSPARRQYIPSCDERSAICHDEGASEKF